MSEGNDDFSKAVQVINFAVVERVPGFLADLLCETVQKAMRRVTSLSLLGT